jgi:hypothetical protein
MCLIARASPRQYKAGREDGRNFHECHNSGCQLAADTCGAFDALLTSGQCVDHPHARLRRRPAPPGSLMSAPSVTRALPGPESRATVVFPCGGK